MAAQTCLLASFAPPLLMDGAGGRPVRAVLALPGVPSASTARASPGLTGCSFKGGSSPFTLMNSNRKEIGYKSKPLSIRCEQSTKGSSVLDVWLGRLAMVGFASAITTEIVTGRGLLENFGLTTPLPTIALALTGIVGVLTAFFIFQSASRD